LLRKNQAFQGSAIRSKPARHNFCSKKLKVGGGPQIFFSKNKNYPNCRPCSPCGALTILCPQSQEKLLLFPKKRLSVMKTLLPQKNKTPGQF
jgi:hypothetical protein